MIKEAYDAMRKDYPVLPRYEDLDKEFEICLIEREHSLLRSVKKKIAEKFELVLDVLEQLINPETTSFADMYEYSCFTNDEKKQILDVFRHLMEHYRLILETDLLTDEQKDAEAIRKLHDVWQQDKSQVIPFVKKMRECWQKHVEPKQVLDYLG